MSIHWIIQFKAIRSGSVYTINIYDDYTGSPVTLTGQANAVDIEEDKEEDMFLPVRTQSGHIRIIDATGGSVLLNQLNQKENKD